MILVHVFLIAYLLFLCEICKSFKDFTTQSYFAEFQNDFFLSLTNNLAFFFQKPLKLDPSEHASLDQMFVMHSLLIINPIQLFMPHIFFKSPQNPELNIEIFKSISNFFLFIIFLLQFKLYDLHRMPHFYNQQAL